MVSSVLYRPPALTARLADDLDHLSRGRAILGLGIGWDATALGWGTNEFERMGLPYPSTRERQEALGGGHDHTRGLGPEPFSFRGRHYTATDAQVVTVNTPEAAHHKFGGPAPPSRRGRTSLLPGLRRRGMEYFVAQILDAGDEETMRLLTKEVAPRVGSA